MLKVGNYGRILELYFPILKQYPRIQLDNTPYPFPLHPTQTQVSSGKANPNKSQVKFRNRQALMFFYVRSVFALHLKSFFIQSLSFMYELILQLTEDALVLSVHQLTIMVQD